MPTCELDDRGQIPWPVDGFLEVHEFACTLKDTPKDDWDDLNVPDINFLDKGRTKTLRFNKYLAMNQIANHILTRWEQPNSGSYLYRYFLITSFLSDHEAELMRDGLARKDDDGGTSFRKILLEALCTTGYSKPIRSTGMRLWKFKYSEVVAKANQLDTDSPDDD